MGFLVSIAILAGGKSKRMGRDKAFLEIGGQSLIERILACVNPLTDDLFISTNSPERFAPFGLRTVLDIDPGKGALGGIYSALTAARHPSVLVVGCDMPFLNRKLLQYLINLAPQAEVIAPRIDPQRPETLHTVYSKNCLPAIKLCLQANRLRIVDFFDEVSIRYVSPAEIAQFDPHFYSFVNLNTPDDWKKAQAMS